MAEDKIVIPGEWVEMTLKMSDREAGAFIKAICIYYFDREEKEITDPKVKELFMAAKPYLDEYIRTPKNKGVKHPLWKGGTTKENNKQRASREYKRFRRAVLERDKFTCQICQKTGGDLHVHHIKRFSEFPEFRFEPSNGITLCEKCHRRLHKNER
jgi:hypothetical protein